MARLPRLSAGGLPHLVEQRGHNGQAIFLNGADRAAYRAGLLMAAADSGVVLHAYCLDAERVLLLATPRDSNGLSRLMQRVGRRYTGEFNRRHGRSGTVWSGRFRATVLQPENCFMAAMCHVESDAALAGDGQAAEADRISSVAHHLGLGADPLVTDHALFWALGNTPFERNAAYGLLVMQPLQPAGRRRFDDAVRKGWALGSDSFLAGLAASTSRRVRPLTAGRPRKTP